jgi:hypothetical protein
MSTDLRMPISDPNGAREYLVGSLLAMHSAASRDDKSRVLGEFHCYAWRRDEVVRAPWNIDTTPYDFYARRILSLKQVPSDTFDETIEQVRFEKEQARQKTGVPTQ